MKVHGLKKSEPTNIRKTAVSISSHFNDSFVSIFFHKYQFSGTDLFREKTVDLKNQTLRIVTFSHTPGTKKNWLNLDFSNGTEDVNIKNHYFSGAEVEVIMEVNKKILNNMKYFRF